jgi:hypothetical protein
MKTHRVSVVGAAFVLTFAYANVASAQRVAHETKGDDTQDTAETANKEAEGPEKGRFHEDEPRINLWIDGVFGFGDVPALNPSPPTTLGVQPTNTLENTHVASDSYIFGGSYKLTESFLVGARLPIVHAAFGPENLEDQRGTTTLGNLELFAAYEKKLTKQLAIIPELGVALPTAPGSELPSGADVAANPAANYDNNANDRFSALQAASAARGLEESALFESHRLGIVPKLELEYKAHGLTIAPYVKWESMISTDKAAEKGYLGEIVGGFLASYRVVKYLDVGVRAWISAAFDKEDHQSNELIVIEPQLRGHIGPIHPTAGLLLPIVPTTGPGNTNNPPTPYQPVFDTRFLALRLSLAATF